jgi:pantoate--beta-alanine ligase
MKVVKTVEQLRQVVGLWRSSGESIGLVPTMGALHEGHLSLARASLESCDRTVVTIFVNPPQFTEGEDLEAYPKTFEADCEKLDSLGVDLVFAPATDEVYRSDHDCWVSVGTVTELWEGAHRPAHFKGVATVVLKLFNMVGADRAFFGQKDFQQAMLIGRMVDQLNVPVEVVICPIVREPDRLAMSSRNAYLSPEARKRAIALSKSLSVGQELIESGQKDPKTIVRKMETTLLELAPDAKIDYIVLADPETLQPVEQIKEKTVLLVAATIESTRLIDNCVARLGKNG